VLTDQLYFAVSSSVKAEMGVTVTLVNPTGPMLSEAASAGFVRKSAHGRLPRLQIVSVVNQADSHEAAARIFEDHRARPHRGNRISANAVRGVFRNRVVSRADGKSRYKLGYKLGYTGSGAVGQ
jgi:hypothetical protein